MECGARHDGPGAAQWADQHCLARGHDVMVDACWEARSPAKPSAR